MSMKAREHNRNGNECGSRPLMVQPDVRVENEIEIVRVGRAVLPAQSRAGASVCVFFRCRSITTHFHTIYPSSFLHDVKRKNMPSDRMPAFAKSVLFALTSSSEMEIKPTTYQWINHQSQCWTEYCIDNAT